VVLVPFPFTDQSTSKKRPAGIISSALYQRNRPDVILMALTSQTAPVVRPAESSVQQWKEAGLLKPSVLKPVLATIDKDLIIRRLGTRQGSDVVALRDCLQAILGE